MRHARKDYNRIQDPKGLIPEDEPVFLLRGQDVFAPATLRFWAEHVNENGSHDDQPLAQIAMKWASEMEKWQKVHKVKFPDLPPKVVF